MAVFARLSALFVVALLASGVTAGTVQERTGNWGGGPSHGGGNSCGKNEFSFKRGGKSCCLPSKPPPTPPMPPAEHECPKRGYYWHGTQKFCVPDHPIPDDDDEEPECPSNCKWNRDDQYCQPQQPPQQPPQHPPQQPPQHPPQPSHGYGGHNGGNNGHGKGNGHWKRDGKSRSPSLCPNGLEACPIQGLTAGEYECLDVKVELESCGGCSSVGQGQDCTAIEGAWNVGCDAGVCAVYTCKTGFIRSVDGSSCIAV